jgi:hypothetical protein
MSDTGARGGLAPRRQNFTDHLEQVCLAGGGA